MSLSSESSAEISTSSENNDTENILVNELIFCGYISGLKEVSQESFLTEKSFESEDQSYNSFSEYPRLACSSCISDSGDLSDSSAISCPASVRVPDNTPDTSMGFSYLSTTERLECYKVTLYKDPRTKDYGFSISNATNQPGIFINHLRKGSEVETCRILQKYDRILQVNSTLVTDICSSEACKIFASAGEKVHLTIARKTNSSYCSTRHPANNGLNKHKSSHKTT